MAVTRSRRDDRDGDDLSNRTHELTALPDPRPPAARDKPVLWSSSSLASSADNRAAAALDEPVYPRAWRFAVVVVALCLAVFCMALDNTIIATAIPKISDEFHAFEDVAWYGSAYLLTTCSFQLFFGRLYSFFAIKPVFLVAVFFFELGSLICGAAPSSVTFIVGRAIAGLGSAGLFSGSLLIIAVSVPLRKRPLYIGLVGSMYGIASVAGPLLGGVFTDKLTWRWCFYINLPFGAVTILFIALLFKSPKQTRAAPGSVKDLFLKLDFPGTLVFIPCFVCLTLILQWGGLTRAWNDASIIALFVVFGILLVAFIALQVIQQDNGTIPPRIIKQRNVLAAVWFCFAFGASFFILVYYVPIWFQAIKLVSALTSGIDSLPLVLACAAFCAVNGAAVTLMGYYAPLMILASVFMGVGSGLISTFNVNSSSAEWIGYQFLAGVGFGLGIQNPVIVVQAVLPPEDIATGIAIVIFFQTLGGALFIAVGENVLLQTLLARLQESFPGFTIEALLAAGATNLDVNAYPALVPIVQAAYNAATSAVFRVATGMAASSILGAVFVEWRSVKGQFMLPAA